MDNVYHVKWIGWNSKKTPIITQNSNGPCPMLAITNVLLLRGKISLPEGCEVVSSEQLLENLGTYDLIYQSLLNWMKDSIYFFYFVSVFLKLSYNRMYCYSEF